MSFRDVFETKLTEVSTDCVHCPEAYACKYAYKVQRLPRVSGGESGCPKLQDKLKRQCMIIADELTPAEKRALIRELDRLLESEGV